ncbi:ARM repeat-containing protein [Epithele typhae]|uniref:ARM repeat-containing protein n=1 Tax=Epithele typhae TaxID=378194 RepID=UPI00200785E3|nr:ARM repeat-containing protein [Epithele typhae]KAH9913980.1 ARM repeat-containing protein [Epithele typhae]
MEQVERLVRLWITSEQEREVEDTVAEITRGNATLLHVVQALGEFLTSEEDDLRTKGVEFLSLVLGKCPPEKLNRQSVRTLVAFYCGKLEDTETIIPALKGLVTLTALPMLTSIDAVEVVKAIFEHVKMKVLIQAQRFTVFRTIDNLVAKYRDAMKGLGEEFVRGYINLAEGEKDPRNLLLAFAIDRVLLIEFDTQRFIEDFFNITFCYFPITFRPPPNDPYAITSEDLKTTLRSCLHATPAFGKLALPLFMEKLTAGSPATKIFQPTDSVIEEKALKTTQVLIKTIYAPTPLDTTADTAEIEGLAKDACNECIQILREPEKSQAKHAIKVLCAFMSTTPSVARFTLSKAIPHFVQLFLNPDELPNRAPTLRLLADLIEAARESTASPDPEVLPDEQVPLAPYKDEVLGVLTVGLKTPASSYPAVDSLKSMVLTRDLLTDEELGFIVHHVNEVLQQDTDDSDVSNECLDLLCAISSFAPSHVADNTLPLLFTSLPDRSPARDAEAERVKYWHTLASLKKLCTQPNLFETLVVRVSTKLDLLCLPSSPLSPEALEPTSAYAHSLLCTLADVLSTKVEAGHTDVVKYVDRLVPRLCGMFVYSALATEDGMAMPATDPRLIAIAGQIVTLVTQTLTAADFIKAMFAAFLDGDVAQLTQDTPKFQLISMFSQEHPRAEEPPCHISAAVITLHKEVSLPVPDEVALLDNLLEWNVTQAETALQREAVMHMVAATLNRHADKLDSFLSSNIEMFWTSQIADETRAADARRHAITTFTWLTKALLVRGHPGAMANVDRLFGLFSEDHVSWDAARAIGRIPGTDKVLTKRNHATLRILYAQKYCNSVLPGSSKARRARVGPFPPRAMSSRVLTSAPSESAQQTAYLVALAALIKSVPKSTYSSEMPALMPLLLRGLDLPDNEIRANVIDTLLAAATSGGKDNTVLTGHASNLVTTMLKNSLASQMPSAKVRLAALRYLATLPNVVRYDVLHPQKATVLRELAKALDDPKRAVRAEAVEARTNWFQFTG